MLDPSWSCMKTAIMEFARSLGRTWFVDHARSFVISHDGSCKFFREDLVCEILFGYLVYGGGGGGLGTGPHFFNKY